MTHTNGIYDNAFNTSKNYKRTNIHKNLRIKSKKPSKEELQQEQDAEHNTLTKTLLQGYKR